MRTWAPKGQTPVIQYHFNWTHISVIAGLSRTNCLFRLYEGSIKKEQHVEFLKALRAHRAGKIAAALCHGSAILRYAKLPNGELLAKGKTVTGFANVEEDFADNAVWSYGLLTRDKHVQPWRIEDELNALGVNYVQAGLWRSFAVRDGNLVTGQQNFSGAQTARVIIAALGE